MSKATLRSHHDSLQQISTALPSTSLSKDRSSFEDFSVESRRAGGSLQVGGGSYNSYLRDHLQRLRKDIENTTGALEREHRRLHKVETDLAAAESEYGQKRQRYRLNVPAADDPTLHATDMARNLERHLEKAIAVLNKGAGDNDKLREQIDQLRRERKVLNTVFKKLERGIGRTNKELNDLVAQISEHRSAMTDAKQTSNALNKKLERERADFRAFAETVKTNLQRAAGVGRDQERGQTKQQLNDAASKRRPYMIADEEDAFSETDMFRRIFRLSFLNTIQRRHIRQHQKNIEVFEQAFATIKSSTGISDIEEIVKIFIALEQRNFSLLTYVNQLNRDIESIEIRNKELLKHLADHKRFEKQSCEKRKLALSDIHTQIDQTRASTKEKNVALDDAFKMLQEVKPVLNKIVAFLKEKMPPLIRAGYEDTAPSFKSLAPSPDDENLINHLTYIEEMLMLFRVALNYNKDKKSDLMSQGKTQGVERPRDLPVAHIQGDDTDDEAEDNLTTKVLLRSELRERACAAIQKRRRKPAQQGRHAEGARIDGEDDPVATSLTLPTVSRVPTGQQHATASGTPKHSGQEAVDIAGGPPASPSVKDGEEDDGASSRWWRASKETKGHTKR